jgi:FKBP-type peptidyl-prolyl cis-trans isomerase
MRRSIALAAVAAVVLFLPACAAETKPKAETKLESENDKLLYALGMAVSRQVTTLKLTEAELETVKAGFADGALGLPGKVDLDAYGPKLNDWAQGRIAAAAGDNKKVGKAFLEKTEKEEGVKKTGTGLLYKIVTEGTGASPAATDRVKVHYTGTLIDGTVFDSSVKRDQPADFGLNQVIPCWTEGMQFLKVGGKAKLYCPSEIAYGERATGSIPPGSTLIFDVELLEILK